MPAPNLAFSHIRKGTVSSILIANHPFKVCTVAPELGEPTAIFRTSSRVSSFATDRLAGLVIEIG